MTGVHDASEKPSDSSKHEDFGRPSPTDVSVEEAEYVPHVGQQGLDENTSGGLGRHLGVFSTVSIIIGRVIGTGIFSTPSTIVSGVGSVGAAMLLWLAGGFISFAGMLIWLELGCMIPRSGGEKVYLEAAFKHPRMLATVVFAVEIILLGFTASGCIVFASNIVVAAGRTATEWEKRGIAIAVISGITMVHTFFPKVGVRGMNFFFILKLVLLLFIGVTGWAILGGAFSSVPDPRASFRDPFAGSSTSANLYATAMFKVLNSYAGWNNAGYIVNEIRNPVRTLKIAGPLSLAICTTLYMLANVAYFAAETPAEVAASGTTVASAFMRKVYGPAAQQALSVLVALSAFGNVMTVTFTMSRVNQELAKEGVLPFSRFWASSWPFGSPSAGLLLHFIPSFIVIVAIPFGDAYNFILDVEGYPGSVVYLFVVIGFFWLRYSQPHANRPFKVWVPVAAFYLVAQAFLVVAPFLRPPGGVGDTPPLPYWLYAVVGLVVLLSGVVYWAVWWKALPALGRYTLVPQHGRLADGTAVIEYRKVKNM